MNKQALAFLTMFSLILMLSVYYVTLPNDTTAVMQEEGTKQKEDETDNDTKQTAKTEEEGTKQNSDTEKTNDTSKVNEAEQLQEEIDQKKDSEINKNSSVVSDEKADETKKKEALTTMEELKNEKNLQQQIAAALSKEKLNVAVELRDKTCTVSVFDQKDDKKLAASIMKTVNTITNQKYFIEVTFK